MNKKELLLEIDNLRNAIVCYQNYEITNKSAKILNKIAPYLTKEEVTLIRTECSEKYMVGCIDADDLGGIIQSIYIEYDLLDTHIDNIDDVLCKYFTNYSYEITFGNYLTIKFKDDVHEGKYLYSKYLLVNGHIKKLKTT